MIEEIKRRSDWKEKVEDYKLYTDALLNLVGELVNQLQKKLTQENRFKGMAKSYINSMWDAMIDICPEISEDEEIAYHRILYLFKKTIQREYSGLVLHRRLSQGDATITILLRVLESITERISDDYPWVRKVKTLEKLSRKFYDNIKNPKKEVQLVDLSDGIKECWRRGKIGRFTTRKLELPDLRRNILELDVLENPGERMEIETEIEGKEVDL